MFKNNDNSKKIVAKLRENRYEAYLVGGCIRDTLLNQRPHDIDIATNASVEEIMKIFGKNAIPTGIDYGTITVIVDDEAYEITTYRKETYSDKDKRRPSSIESASTIQEDLSRRDFTINAMAYNEEQGLIDPYGGAYDLMNRRLKCVGDPIKRLNEDRLRILRGYRFAVTLDLQFEAQTEAAMKSMLPLICSCSKERIIHEIDKIFRASVSRAGLETLFSSILPVIFPELGACIGFDQKNPHHSKTLDQHLIDTILNVDEFYEQHQEEYEWLNPIEDMKFAALFHDIAKPHTQSFDESGTAHYYHHAEKSAEMAEQIFRDFHFSKQRSIQIQTLIKNHQIQWPEKIPNIRKTVYKRTEPVCLNLLVFQLCDKKSHEGSDTSIYELTQLLKLIPELKQDPAMLESGKKQVQITGRDVMEILDLVPGIEVRKVLEQIKDEILEGTLRNDRNQIRRRLFEMKGQ